MNGHGVRSMRRINGFGGAIAIVTAVVAACHYLPHIHLSTPCVLLLLSVLMIASRWGFWEGVLATVVGDLLLAYFFIPPKRSWSIESPEYWVVFFAFLAVGIATAHLAARAKRLTVEATDRTRELERLDAWMRSLSVEGRRENVLAQSLDSLTRAFCLEAAAFYDPATENVIRSGSNKDALPLDQLRRATALDRSLCVDRASSSLFTSIHIDGQATASFGVRGGDISQPTFRTIAERLESGLEKSLALERSTKAEAARRSQELKSAVLDSLIHEVKTPLSVIKTAVSSLLSSDWEAARALELLDIVDEQVDRLDASVDEVFWTAYIEAGTLEPARETQDARRLVEAVLKELEPQLSSRPLKVDITDVSPSAEFDFQMIKGVLKELLKNALKYSPPGSSLAISARQSGDEVIFGVTDSGIGVKPGERTRIFDKHYRGDVAPAGTGLGLAIAKTIVEAHGGRIGVAPHPDTGSTFYFSLPVSRRDN